jgi:hypothetical protein
MIEFVQHMFFRKAHEQTCNFIEFLY